MFETKSGILLIAGIGFFAVAFLSNAVVPMVMYADVKEKTVEELVNRNLLIQLRDLNEHYPEPFQKHIGDYAHTEYLSDRARKQCADLLREGHKVYVAEACWHCHSQFVRPVANESKRWGPVSESWEYDNELQRPVLFGTRRVGPDLCREGGRRGNDWHAVHFYRPRDTSPESVMPEYPWLFDGSPGKPNRRGLALIVYMQWLGSWLDSYPYYKGSNRDPESR